MITANECPYMDYSLLPYCIHNSWHKKKMNWQILLISVVFIDSAAYKFGMENNNYWLENDLYIVRHPVGILSQSSNS